MEDRHVALKVYKIYLLVHCDLWVISLFSGMPHGIFVKGIIITDLNLNRESIGSVAKMLTHFT